MLSLKEYFGAYMMPVMSGQQGTFMVVLTSDCIQRLVGIESKKFYYDADAFTEISYLYSMYVGSFPALSPDQYNFEVEALGQELAIGKMGLPDVSTVNPLIKNKEDVFKVKWPTANPLDAGRYPFIAKCNDLTVQYLGFPSPVLPIASTFTIACNLMTFPKLMKYIKKDPEYVHEAMAYLVDEIHTPLIKAACEKYPGLAIKFADAWEMVPNISPKIQREFVFPYYDRLRENCAGVTDSLTWWMCYGEGSMPDPVDYLKEKIPYSGQVTYTGTEGVPMTVYRDVALQEGCPMLVQVPSTLLSTGSKDEIISFMKAEAKDLRAGTNPATFVWTAPCQGGTDITNFMTASVVGKALSALPELTPEQIDALEVEIPEPACTFREFLNEAMRENPDGFTFKWVDDIDPM